MVDSPPGQANLNLNMLDAWASFSLALPFFSSDKAMAPCNCRCKVLARLQKPCAQVVDSCPTGPQHQSGNSGSAAIHARPHSHVIGTCQGWRGGQPLRSQAFRCRRNTNHVADEMPKASSLVLAHRFDERVHTDMTFIQISNERL